jgi:hypothetical protein
VGPLLLNFSLTSIAPNIFRKTTFKENYPGKNKVLRRIFEPKRDEVTGEWRRLHNKELYALYSSPNIIRVIKSRRLRWAGHVARMGKR